MRPRLVAALLLTVAMAAGCGPTGSPPPPAASGTTPSTAAPTTSGPPAGGTTSEPPESGGEYKVSYNWGVPSSTVQINHPRPVPPLSTLVAIYVGNHPEASPRYQRISFYFRDGFPSYRFEYVARLLSDGAGLPVPLPGNSFLQIVFVEANAHTEAGASSIVSAPPPTIGFQNLKGYAFAGDFEGYVTYGLGIQVAPNSDQVLKIRAGELKKPDGYFVVHFDVQTA
jgi:hypothetical protein